MTKTKSIRTRVLNWSGPVVPPQGSFCTNASDALWIKGDAMASFRFHQWLTCEIETEDGTIGIGNAALASSIVKPLIDEWLAPLSGVDLPVPLLVRMAQEIEVVDLFKIECPRAADKVRSLIEAGGRCPQSTLRWRRGHNLAGRPGRGGHRLYD